MRQHLRQHEVVSANDMRGLSMRTNTHRHPKNPVNPASIFTAVHVMRVGYLATDQKVACWILGNQQLRCRINTKVDLQLHY